MMKSSGFVRDVIAKHFYTILTSIEFQWILNLAISELAIHTETRGGVLINIFSVRIGSRIALKSAYIMNGTLN